MNEYYPSFDKRKDSQPVRRKLRWKIIVNNILQEGKIVPEATFEERVVKSERLVEMVLQHVDVSVRKKD